MNQLDIRAQLLVPDSGEYRFELRSDNRAILSIDGNTVLDDRLADAASLSLDEGNLAFRLRYWQLGGAALLRLDWDRPAFLELLPLEHYLADRNPPTAVELARKELTAGLSLLLAVAWWCGLGVVLPHIGAQLRASYLGILRRAYEVGIWRPRRLNLVFLFDCFFYFPYNMFSA